MFFAYKAENLKKRFPELKQLDDLTVVPLMDVIICDFLEDLQNEPRKYDITNFYTLHEYDRKNIFDDEYVAMLGVVAIEIKVYYTDIYVVDGGAVWYMCSSVIFNSGDASEFAQGLRTKLKEFVKRQNLSELKRKVIFKLKKAKPKHLIPKIAEFYSK